MLIRFIFFSVSRILCISGSANLQPALKIHVGHITNRFLNSYTWFFTVFLAREEASILLLLDADWCRR
jgi:hypothetical protein